MPGPTRINLVTIVLALALAGAGYAGYRFIPVYLRNIKIHSMLDDRVNQYWKSRHDPTPVRAQAERQMRKELIRDLRDLGVDDEDLAVQFTTDKLKVSIEVRYTVVIEHPFIKKYTILPFQPRSETDVSTPW